MNKLTIPMQNVENISKKVIPRMGKSVEPRGNISEAINTYTVRDRTIAVPKPNRSSDKKYLFGMLVDTIIIESITLFQHY